MSKDLVKALPNDDAIEKVVLGAVLVEDMAVNAMMSNIANEEIFANIKHQKIFIAIKNLFDKNEPIDLVTVSRQLKENGSLEMIGGPFYLNQITYAVNSSANIENHIFHLKKLWVRRVLIHQSALMNNASFDESIDPALLMKKIQDVINRTIDFLSAKKSNSIQTVVSNIMSAGNSVIGRVVPSCLYKVDKTLGGGFWNSTFTIIAARPGMGKTAFAVQVAKNTACNDVPVLIFSLEMSETQLGYRFLSNVSNLHANDIKNQKLNDFELTQLSQSTKIIDDMKLFIDDDVNLTINSLRAKAISMKMKHGIGLVIVDYLQLITTDENSSYREQEISKISRGLKKLSKELDIPVIALSQLSRKVEERGGAKRPILSDLRESGTLEQDADNVIFLLRQEYYLVEEDPEYTETNGSTKGILEVIIAKNREGKTGQILTRCNMGTNLVYDLTPDVYITEATTIELPSRPNIFNQVQSEFEFQTQNTKQDKPPF